MSDTDDPITLDSIEESMTINCALSSKYAAQWEPVAAFRELVQNWRDGIIKSFRIPEKSFQIERHDNDDNGEIIYKATQKGKSGSLGYIRWSLLEGTGTVEISNRRATLQPWHLDMGGTSKENETDQAGAHGEGLKVALLVLMRWPQNHAVRCVSGGFYWSFYFNKQKKLVVHLTKNPDPEIRDISRQANAAINKHPFLADLKGVTSRSVHFFIDRTGRDKNGLKLKKEVTRNEFEEWTKAALFLQSIDDHNIVRTPYGDLIFDPEFGGNVYLKGLLLKRSTRLRSASITGKRLRYGYNFADGATNRERESVAAADDESHAIASIWDYAISWGHIVTKREDLIDMYHNLLNSRNPEYADVAKAGRFIELEGTLAESLKDYLRMQHQGRWFYTATERNSNPRFDNIVQGLGHEPFELKESYWEILRDNGFKTAAEKETQEFLAASRADIPEDDFSQNLNHLINAALQSCRQTNDVGVVFVLAGSLGLDAFFSKSSKLLKIHQKWLTAVEAAAELGLPQKIPMYSLLFSTARRLLADTILQVPLDRFPAGNRTSYWSQRQAIGEVDQRILEYTQIKQGLWYTRKTRPNSDNDMTLVVTWNPTTGWIPDSRVYVLFHRESTCLDALKAVRTAGKLKNGLHLCGNRKGPPKNRCRIMRADFQSGKCEIHVLNTEKYFVTLSNRSDENSFVVFSDEPEEVEEALPKPSIPKDTTKIFTLGDSIDSLDIMTPRNWHHGSNSVGTEAVIGIPSDEPVRRSKRRRVDTT